MYSTPAGVLDLREPGQRGVRDHGFGDRAAGVAGQAPPGRGGDQRRSEEVAQAIQLGIEYDPQPPFDAGSPAKAPAPIVELLRGRSRFLAATEAR